MVAARSGPGSRISQTVDAATLDLGGARTFARPSAPKIGLVSEGGTGAIADFDYVRGYAGALPAVRGRPSPAAHRGAHPRRSPWSAPASEHQGETESEDGDEQAEKEGIPAADRYARAAEQDAEGDDPQEPAG